MNVSVSPSGRVAIDASADEAATLAGRPFGDTAATMRELRERIADAWYVADCPPDDDAAPDIGGAMRRALRAVDRRRHSAATAAGIARARARREAQR